MYVYGVAALLAVLGMQTDAQVKKKPALTEMAGYLIVPHDKVPTTFNAGFSMYVAAWPLLETYPGQDFQSGLFGTWMFPQPEGKKLKDFYTDIEGGLGWWRDTRFATETPKFIMGGVALNFSEWANGPGAGKGRNWKNPTGLYGIAQLSQNILWPPDGLNLKQGTRGELFGYGYLPLPLTSAKTSTAGKNVPTGNQSWTLFLNTANFKGPVTFFTPYFWSKASATNPDLAGQFLDSRPSEPNKAIQMETQHIPAMVSQDAKGDWFARIAPTHFPAGSGGEAPLIHQVTAYSRDALWNSVETWFGGGAKTEGTVSSAASAVHNFKPGGYATWKIYLPGNKREQAHDVDLAGVGAPKVLANNTYGFSWDATRVTTKRALVTLPEYYRLIKDAKGKERWAAVSSTDVPSDTGLLNASFPKPKRDLEPYITPDELSSSWKSPGPAAGPFTRILGDGSEVTYYWYRFADQPALMNADISTAEREALQKRVELLHKEWKSTKEFLPAPTTGKLASIDPAAIVKPPKGMEVGYVPVVTKQGWSEKRRKELSNR